MVLVMTYCRDSGCKINMLGKQHVVMVHYIANIAIFLKYGRVRFINGDMRALFVVLVGVNHKLPHHKEKQQQPGIYYKYFSFIQFKKYRAYIANVAIKQMYGYLIRNNVVKNS